MDSNRPPYWFWRLDRWKLLAALLLALLALFMPVRGCGAPQVTPPDITLPEVALPEVQLPRIALPNLVGLKAGTPFALEGTGEPGGIVRIYDDGKLIGETVADADGKWKFTLSVSATPRPQACRIWGSSPCSLRSTGGEANRVGCSPLWAS